MGNKEHVMFLGVEAPAEPESVNPNDWDIDTGEVVVIEESPNSKLSALSVFLEGNNTANISPCPCISSSC